MKNLVFTEVWGRYDSEAPSCGATLRVAEQGGRFLLVRADAWTGDFKEMLSSHASLTEAEAALLTEARSH